MIAHGLTDTYRAEVLFGGIHLPEHEYRMALYVDHPSAIVLGPETASYTPDGEVRGQGYEAGGKVLEMRKVQLLGGVACMDWPSPVWPLATIRGVRGGLIYNASLPGKNSVCVVDFGDEFTSINAPFIARLPQPGPTTSLIQWV